MIQPPTLQKGDRVILVAPGRKLDRHILAQAVEVLKSWQLEIVVAQNVFSEKHSYLSGTDGERLSDLQNALDDSSAKAIICARGGYGTTRFVDQLDFQKFVKNPKWICGFSDITALHLKLNTIGVQSIHSTMPVLFAQNDSVSSVKSLRQVLFGQLLPVIAQADSYNSSGEATAEVVGGNLSLILDSFGTSSEISTENKILIIEEVDEYLYKIDRMMVQLKRAGKLETLSGLVVGHMTDSKETTLPFGEDIKEIIASHVKDYQFPVAFNFPTGHQNPNLAWRSGAKATLTVSATESTLVFNES